MWNNYEKTENFWYYEKSNDDNLDLYKIKTTKDLENKVFKKRGCFWYLINKIDKYFRKKLE